ncbi:hypothetical protein CYG49_05025 [Candidatus Saccharibacteria bacterium]|nr:MAG: hypothetical protein CYG49_05025 [Candidatus Saccharibacteria bacterium]
MTSNNMNRQRGFTLVEVIVVIPMLAIVVAILITFMVNIYASLLSKNDRLQLEANAQNALFNTRDDLLSAVRFSGKIQSDTNDLYAPAGGWDAIEDNALIIYESSYTKNRQSSDRQLIYKKDMPHACDSSLLYENQYSTNTLILFVNNKKLYRRILIPDQSNNCLTTFRQQTCPPEVGSCPSDSIIAENVKELKLRYFRRNNNQEEIDAATLLASPSFFVQISRVELSLTLEKMVNAEPVTVNAKIDIKKVE